MPTPTGQSSGSTAVNLSRLPFPDVIATLDHAAIVAEIKAEIIADAPEAAEALALESELLTKAVRRFAYRELNLLARMNDAVRSRLIAFATGADLDHVCARIGVQRLVLAPAGATGPNSPAVMEADEDLRSRALLAWEALSTAGPELAYVFWARGASGNIRDASCTSPAPCQVVVTVLSRINGGLADEAMLQAVVAAVNAKNRRPLTDQVVVQACAFVDFAIEADLWFYPGPDAALVIAEARARLDRYLSDSFMLGVTVTTAGVIAALKVEGVQNVKLIGLDEDVVVDLTQAARCTGVVLNNRGLA